MDEKEREMKVEIFNPRLNCEMKSERERETQNVECVGLPPDLSSIMKEEKEGERRAYVS